MNSQACVLIALVSILSFGCGKPNVVPMDGDTYLVQERSAQIGFGPPEGAKAEAYKVANEFCASQHKVVETVAFNMIDSGFARPGSVSLQFRCVTATAAARPNPLTGTSDRKLDVATKLDDLKKLLDRELITKEDYERKKKEILDKL